MAEQKQGKILSHEELERRILHGLSCEWEKALWILSSDHRKMMRPPLFNIRDMPDRWGYWSSGKREISLSRDLVLNHSWDSGCEVLLHEVAHQFTSEVLAAHHEPPHGPQFQKACYLLRANPKASGKYHPLDKRVSEERIFNGSASLEDKILGRVRKLFALAESQYHHEADAAMSKAHALISKYNLDLLAKAENRDFTSIFVGRPALRHPSEAYALAHLLQDFYFVKGIWVSAYVPEKEKMGRVLEISGTIPNIKMASYVHDFGRRFIQSQWAEYNKNKKLNRWRQTDFAVGIIEGFRSKLEAQRREKEKGQSPQALMKIEDPLLKKYIAYKYPHTVRISRGVSSRDEKVWKEGKRVGKKLVICKGIEDREGNRGLLLKS
ncbi:MAG: DUF2786 domain-containing protein [Deltaproteobacteria bacterium]|nr:DUF2786 domain-containing protein [Deltaproteobacteria bacterium]